MRRLVVLQPFGAHQAGDRISSTKEIERVLANPELVNFVVATGDEPEPDDKPAASRKGADK